MYPKIILYLAVFSLLYLNSCNNTPTGDMVLNDGTKWQINAEMMPPLQTSNQLISEYVASDN